jgi:phage tail-like protein
MESSESVEQQGNGAARGYLTFTGKGFGTIQFERAVGDQNAPRSVSDRTYLRGGLPAVYQEGDFGMRFIGALELVLDPIVALLDNIAAHFSAEHAPRDVLELLMGWLGLDHDEAYRIEDRRELVRHAPELVRCRGTRAGLELALELAFPGLPLRVEDEGGVSYSTKLEQRNSKKRPSFVVYCDEPIPEPTQAAIARLLQRLKPAHTIFRLRVKAPRAAKASPAREETDP